MKSKYKFLVKNSLLIFGGGIGVKLITLLMMPVYTSWLSVEAYGLIDVLTVYVALFINVVSFCIPDALFVFPCNTNKNNQKIYFSSGLSFNFFTIIVFGIITFLIYHFSRIYKFENSFTNNIILLYLLLVTGIIQQQVQQFSRSINHIIVYSLTGLVYTISFVILTYILVKKNGVNGYITCIAISNIIATVYCVVFSKSLTYFNVKLVRKAALIRMLKYSIPLIPNSIMWWLVNALNRPVIEHYLGLYDIGIYAVANRFPGILTVIFTLFITSWQISVLDEFNKRDFDIFFNRILRVIFSLMSIVLIAIVLSSKILVSIFANSNYIEAWKYIGILSMGTLVSCVSSFVGVIFSATKESKYYLYSSIIGAITSIICNLILIPIFALWGACISVVISFGAISLSRIIYSKKNVIISSYGYYIIVFSLLSITIMTNVYECHIISHVTAMVTFAYIILNNKMNIVSLIKTVKYKKIS